MPAQLAFLRLNTLFSAYSQIVDGDSMMSKRKHIFEVFFLLFLFGLSLFRCQFSMDWDEEYTILVASQVADGYSMFGDIWASHQTSAMFLAPFILFWKTFFGKTGLILGIRVLSVCAVLLSAVCIYFTLRDILDETVSFFISIVFFLFLPRGTISLEYGLLLMIFTALSLCFLLHASKIEKHSSVYFILSSVFWAFGILCYPYLIIATAVYILGFPLLFRENKTKKIIQFLLINLLIGVSFLVIVLSRSPAASFAEAIHNIMADPFHNGSFISRFSADTVIEVAKKILILIAASLPVPIIRFLQQKKSFFHKDNLTKTLILMPFVSYSLVLILGNITGLYITGCMGVSVGYFYFLMIVAAISVIQKNRMFLWLCILGFSVHFIAYMQGNLTFKDYYNYLYIPLFLAVYILFQAKETRTDHPISHPKSLKCQFSIQSLSFAVFLVCLIYTKICCVRIDGINYSTIFESREKVTEGIYKGIFLYQDDAELFVNKQRILEEYTDDSSVSLIIDENCSANLMANGKYIFVAAVDGRVEVYNSDPRWISYIDSSYHKKPTVLFIDRHNITDADDFLKLPLGTYLARTFDFDKMITAEDYFIFCTEQ